MNCPQCGQRNPSSAKRCLHCNTQFEVERESLLDSVTDSDSSGNSMIWIFTAVVVAVIGGSMFLFGFDTYDSKCVRNETAAAEMDADPEWERDESAERRKRERDARRMGKKTQREIRRHSMGFMQCYRKKTGHVDGVTE